MPRPPPPVPAAFRLSSMLELSRALRHGAAVPDFGSANHEWVVSPGSHHHLTLQSVPVDQSRNLQKLPTGGLRPKCLDPAPSAGGRPTAVAQMSSPPGFQHHIEPQADSTHNPQLLTNLYSLSVRCLSDYCRSNQGVYAQSHGRPCAGSCLSNASSPTSRDPARAGLLLELGHTSPGAFSLWFPSRPASTARQSALPAAPPIPFPRQNPSLWTVSGSGGGGGGFWQWGLTLRATPPTPIFVPGAPAPFSLIYTRPVAPAVYSARRAAACPSAANESPYASILAGLHPARMTSTLLPWTLTSAFDFTRASATLPTTQGRQWRTHHNAPSSGPRSRIFKLLAGLSGHAMRCLPLFHKSFLTVVTTDAANPSNLATPSPPFSPCVASQAGQPFREPKTWSLRLQFFNL